MTNETKKIKKTLQGSINYFINNLKQRRMKTIIVAAAMLTAAANATAATSWPTTSWPTQSEETFPNGVTEVEKFPFPVFPNKIQEQAEFPFPVCGWPGWPKA